MSMYLCMHVKVDMFGFESTHVFMYVFIHVCKNE